MSTTPAIVEGKFAPAALGQPATPLDSETTKSSLPVFPKRAYIGVAGEFAELHSEAYESPNEFFYMDFVTLIGLMLSGRLRADFGGLNTQPRLYLLKIGRSGWARKSTSTKMALDFIRGVQERMNRKGIKDAKPILSADLFRPILGAGSAEGLANAFGHFVEVPGGNKETELQFVGNRRIPLIYDEFRRFEKKAKGDTSVLIAMVNEMFEANDYDNVTKLAPLEIRDGHLSFLSNTTEDTFRSLVDAAEMTEIGFLNRVFLVVGNTTTRKPIPKAPPRERVQALQDELADMLSELSPLDKHGKSTGEIVVPMTAEAEEMWRAYYVGLPQTETTARLDAIGMRLMGVLTFLARKRVIDAEIMRAVIAMLEYERKVRELFRPLQGQNPQARAEEKIVEQLKRRGKLTRRELQIHTNARRSGTRIFEDSLKALKASQEIKVVTETGKNGRQIQKYQLGELEEVPYVV